MCVTGVMCNVSGIITCDWISCSHVTGSHVDTRHDVFGLKNNMNLT